MGNTCGCADGEEQEFHHPHQDEAYHSQVYGMYMGIPHGTNTYLAMAMSETARAASAGTLPHNNSGLPLIPSETASHLIRKKAQRESGSTPGLMGQNLSSSPSTPSETPTSSDSSPRHLPGKKRSPRHLRPPPLVVTNANSRNRSFSWCESMSPAYLSRNPFFPPQPPDQPWERRTSGASGQTNGDAALDEAEAVQELILLAKKQAKTVKLLNGDLYIDYKYVGPLPDGCRV